MTLRGITGAFLADVSCILRALKPISAVLCFALVCQIGHAQVVWNFGGTSGSLSAANSFSQITVSSLSGTNLGTFLNNSTSESSGYTGVSGNFNAGGTAPIGAFNLSTSAYFSFTLTPNSGHQLEITSLTFGSRSTGTGPLNFSVRSSSDSFASELASATASNNSVWGLKTPTFTSVTITSGLTLRIYGYGGSGSVGSGNWRIDDLTVSGNVSAVPEPSTYAILLGMTSLGWAFWQRNRRSYKPAGRLTSPAK